MCDSEKLTPKEVADLLSADRNKLNDLIHNLTAEKMIEALQHPELGTSPGVLQAALRYLKDNGVEALPTPGSKIQELSDSLPFRRTGTE